VRAIGVIEAAGGRVERALEAARPRCDAVVLAHVPLAAHDREVARRPQHLGDGHAATVEAALVARLALVLGHVADARLVRVETGQQRGARRAAARGVIELREAQAVRRERVEIRRRNLAAVAAEVGEAHVIHEDDDDVRPRLIQALENRRLTFSKAWKSQRAERAQAREFQKITASDGAHVRTPLYILLTAIPPRPDALHEEPT